MMSPKISTKIRRNMYFNNWKVKRKTRGKFKKLRNAQICHMLKCQKCAKGQIKHEKHTQRNTVIEWNWRAKMRNWREMLKRMETLIFFVNFWGGSIVKYYFFCQLHWFANRETHCHEECLEHPRRIHVRVAVDHAAAKLENLLEVLADVVEGWHADLDRRVARENPSNEISPSRRRI